jgi:hypothetical protein
MDDKIPEINMVVYLVASVTEVGKRKHYFLGGHGYTYDRNQEGKKKLAKDVPTSTGYYTGNPQKPNTVVVVEDILTLVVPNAHTQMEAMLKGFWEILHHANVKGLKNLWVVTPHKEMELISKIKAPLLSEVDPQVGKHTLNNTEKTLAQMVVIEMEQITSDKDRKLFFDFTGSAEGGMGNRDAQKQLDLAEVISQWGYDKDSKLIVQSRKDYENPEVDFNKIVSASRWYFESHDPEKFIEEQHGYRVYNFGKVEPDKNYYGKLTPDVTYSKLYTKRPIEILDKLFNFTVKRIENPDGYLSAGDLNHVVSKDVARLVDTVPAVPVKHQLVSPFVKQNGRPVLIELIKPTMMSYRIRDFLVGMDVIMESWLKKDENNVFGHAKFYNITDMIYVKEVNGKGVTKLKVHPDFNQLRSTIKVNVEHRNSIRPVPILLSVGYDIPERNAFNSVEDPNVEVWVVTDTRNELGLRYSTLVVTEEFIYVHTSAIANLRVLTLGELGRKA